jgi:hypothetical protein
VLLPHNPRHGPALAAQGAQPCGTGGRCAGRSRGMTSAGSLRKRDAPRGDYLRPALGGDSPATARRFGSRKAEGAGGEPNVPGRFPRPGPRSSYVETPTAPSGRFGPSSLARDDRKFWTGPSSAKYARPLLFPPSGRPHPSPRLFDAEPEPSLGRWRRLGLSPWRIAMDNTPDQNRLNAIGVNRPRPRRPTPGTRQRCRRALRPRARSCGQSGSSRLHSSSAPRC